MQRGKIEKEKQRKNKKGYPPTTDATKYEIITYPKEHIGFTLLQALKIQDSCFRLKNAFCRHA